MGIYLTRLALENFANIYTGLNTTYLEIDFSKMQHTVCVIIGKNGRGKTSLLSYMTPFSGVGNVDVRSGETIIRPGLEGRKSIRFLNDTGDVYHIQHFYTPNSSGGHAVKSYISENGNELNLNGNVRSFEQYVYELLGIDTDYIRLVRIGDNISNIIDAKATERKTFMAKLLDSVDVYLRQYKRKVQQVSELTAVVSHIADEITKTGVEDVKEAKKELEHLEKELRNWEKWVDDSKADETKAQYELELTGLTEDPVTEMREYENKLGRYQKIWENLPEGATSESVGKQIAKLELEEAKLRTKLEVHQLKFDMLLDKLDTIHKKIEEDETALLTEEQNLNLLSLEASIKELEQSANDAYESRFDEIEIKCSKKEFDELVIFLKNLRMYVSGIYEFGVEPIRDVIRLIKDGKSVDEYVRGALIKLEDSNRKQDMGLLDKLIIEYKNAKQECDVEGCPYRNLHKELMKIKDTKAHTEKKLRDESYYHSVNSVKDGIAHVFTLLLETKFPFWVENMYPKEISDIFVKDTIMKRMSKLEPLCDMQVVDKWMTFMSERETYRELCLKVEEQRQIYEERLKISKAAELRRRIEESTNELHEVQKEIYGPDDGLHNILTLGKMKLEKMVDELEVLRENFEAITQFEVVQNEYDELVRRRHAYYGAKNKLAAANEKVSRDTFQRDKFAKQVNALTNSIERYKVLQAELKEKTEILDILEYIKFGLSNTKGLPLYYIKYYLQDVLVVANRLLDIIYDGKCYLNDFEISESAFKMPYTKNDITISDVSSASQGEKSFFNMAISSALRAQSMEKYNIALFDEVDSVFDDDNRQKTIPVLEELLEISKINQAFLITHNQMFNQYPTDVINLDNPEDSTIPVRFSMIQTSWDISI